MAGWIDTAGLLSGLAMLALAGAGLGEARAEELVPAEVVVHEGRDLPELDEELDTGALEAAELRLLSVNIWGVPYPFSRPFHARRAAVVDLIAETDPDLVAMQEVFRRWVGMRKLKEALGPDRRLHRAEDGAQSRRERRRDSGLVTVVRKGRKPEDGHNNRLLELFPKNLDETLADKGVQRFDLLADNGAVVPVFNLHLIAGGSGFRQGPRRAQVEQMLEEMVSPTTGPAVMVGDFNLEPPGPGACEEGDGWEEDWHLDCGTEALIREAGFRDAAVVISRRTGLPLASTHVGGSTARYDRVYVRDGGGWCLDVVDLAVLTHEDAGEPDPLGLSDHKPLLVDLRVRSCSAEEALARLGVRSPG